MSKNIQYVNLTLSSGKLPYLPAEQLETLDTNASDAEALGSFLDFTSFECKIIFSGFSISAFVGSTCNLFLLVVLVFKMWCDSKNKSPSDLLVAVLTTIDLVACSVLFPLECILFSHDDCNIEQRTFDRFLTLFLELSSTGALLNIAVCRYLLVCWATQIQVTFKLALIISSVNIVVSLVCAAVSIFLQTINIRRVTVIVYLLGILTVMVLMALLYYLIFLRLYKRAEIAKKRSKNLLVPKTTPSRDTHRLTVERGEGEYKSGEHVEESNCGSSPGKKRDSLKPLKVPVRPQLSAIGRRTSKNSQTNQASQMELMMKRSAKVFVIITAFYIFCFLPNAILMLFYIWIGPEFILADKPVLIEYIIKYLNLFYNINFILMPLVYAILNRQFREDILHLKQKLFTKHNSTSHKLIVVSPPSCAPSQMTRVLKAQV